MDITDVKLFLAIIETNSITSAAEMLHFSQSTASYRLKNLEKELGAPLFTRNRGNRADLTPQGESFVSVAKRWQAVWEDTQAVRFLPATTLSVASIESVNTSVLSPVYRALLEEMGDSLKLKVMTHQSPEIYELLENQTADVGIVSIEQQRRNIETISTFTQRYCIVRHCENPGPPRLIRPETLDPTREIYLNWGTEYTQWHEDVWGELTRYHAWVDTVTLLESLLTGPALWAVLPDSLLTQLLRYSRRIQIDWLDMPEELLRTCYVIRHRRPKSSSEAAVSRFLTLLEEQLAKQREQMGRL